MVLYKLGGRKNIFFPTSFAAGAFRGDRESGFLFQGRSYACSGIVAAIAVRRKKNGLGICVLTLLQSGEKPK